MGETRTWEAVSMATWSYLVMENIDGPQLDKLGEDGWELVGVTPYPVTEAGTFTEPTSWQFRFYFKRPR